MNNTDILNKEFEKLNQLKDFNQEIKIFLNNTENFWLSLSPEQKSMISFFVVSKLSEHLMSKGIDQADYRDFFYKELNCDFNMTFFNKLSNYDFIEKMVRFSFFKINSIENKDELLQQLKKFELNVYFNVQEKD